MNLPRDLLGQAHQLAGHDPGRPRQVSLRRAVSAAYYAMFHLLVGEASQRLVRGRRRRALRQTLARSFAHDDMRETAEAFAHGRVPRGMRGVLGSTARPTPLVTVATAFIDLQEARHEADYDPARRFTRRECRELLRRAEKAFDAWRDVRTTLHADAFLVALLAHRRLRG